MVESINKIIDNIKDKLCPKQVPCLAGISKTLTSKPINSNITYFWSSSFDRAKSYRETKQTHRIKTEHEKTLEKINMLMNNLEQRLRQEPILCEQVDKAICITVEIEQAKSDLQSSDLSQAVIQYQMQGLDSWLHKERCSIQQNVIDTLQLSEREIIDNYMTKVQMSLQQCI